MRKTPHLFGAALSLSWCFIMSDDLKNLLQSIGALSELLSIMREKFEKSGFSREESVYLVGVILSSIIKNTKDGC